MARTVMCPVADQTQCAQAIKEYAASQLIEQIVRSVPLMNNAVRLHAGAR